MAAKIYFDESGYTGNNLLNKDQPIFSYASVCSDDDEARDYVERAVKRYGIQNGELKGSKLIKFNKGRKAVSEILKDFKGNIKVSVSDKKYALAGKFFEYIFEPAISDDNALFYGLDFHRFVSNILYVEFVARGSQAEELFEDFERLMKTGDFDGLGALFSSTKNDAISPILSEIKEFAILNKGAVIDELDGYVGTGAGKWVLDLTNTSLFSLLAEWGRHHDELTAFCDNSKPLSQDQSIFEAMIGRTDKIYENFSGGSSPITFNLTGPLNLVDSKVFHGVQIADAVAAAFAYCCDGRNQDDHAREWRGYIEEMVIPASVFPDVDHVDLRSPKVVRNAILLQELVSRSQKGHSLIDGMREYVSFISGQLSQNPLNITTWPSRS
ncbi:MULTISPECIES: DUF3800 domain-containing protein [Pseudomonas]|uniref:DUF3800 domain-containing protein n=1 Tax=Pseudomonas TaxID=286 RepID=UPI000F53980C|nr:MULTISPECIES: DUF3800 domain-containing protein [Pseudomonas]RQI46550.1 hypothetical protein IPC17_26380 [Pseudomonas aeruginosa]RQI63032.1 hypothetical protein IPC16_26405 [Pseudomonas aeruginosa]HBN8562918.1 DUF3800 domain-containing protein [Pseudomonas aeruginosa]HBP1419765.1 DUF3800 domain-containing protein [Pseudomonas aeruginosa]HBP6754773.1 DUF3800 domain-containing protein [Pseudomonas aeruginosa]